MLVAVHAKKLKTEANESGSTHSSPKSGAKNAKKLPNTVDNVGNNVSVMCMIDKELSLLFYYINVNLIYFFSYFNAVENEEANK